MLFNNAEVNLVQWNKFGDHPLVKKEHSSEFPYDELFNEGCGFINNFQVVHPGDFILEINGHFISVLSKEKFEEVFSVQLK